MKLRQFIKKLKEISKRRGEEMEVVMADNIKAADPVFMNNYPHSEKVVITDGK